jgi:hypothetical protein
MFESDEIYSAVFSEERTLSSLALLTFLQNLSPRPTPLHYLVAEFFDSFVHVDLPVQEGPTTRRLRQDGAGPGEALHSTVGREH